MPTTAYRFILSVCIILITTKSEGQECISINMPDSVNGCPDSVASISATLTVRSGLTVIDTNWVPSTGVSDASSINPTFTGTAPVLYTLQVFTLTDTDHIFNGDFSDSTLGFSTQYIPQSSGTNPGHYAVTKIVTPFHYLYPPNLRDHTTGTGFMLLVDGALDPNLYFWQQTASVEPDRYYEFSFWAATLLVPAARIKTSINGKQLFTLQLGDSAGLWTFYHATWYSDKASTANIDMFSMDDIAFGNDFVIDDIALRNVCLSSKDVYVNLCAPKPVSHIFDLPKGFSPNGDGRNDVLYARGINVKSFSMSIFNRWGQKLFETSDMSNGWDGTYKGEKQPIDNYTYVATVTFTDNYTEKKSGYVVLVR